MLQVVVLMLLLGSVEAFKRLNADVDGLTGLCCQCLHSSFSGALLGSMLGQYLARRMQMIASIFVLLAMIPLVPGLGLYRFMSYLAQEMYGAGADAGVRAMVYIVMIALGLAMGSFIFRLIANRPHLHKEGAVK